MEGVQRYVRECRCLGGRDGQPLSLSVRDQMPGAGSEAEWPGEDSPENGGRLRDSYPGQLSGTGRRFCS